MVFFGYSTNTGLCHDIAEILLKVALNTITTTVYQGYLHRNNKLLNIALIEIYTFFYHTELAEERSTDVSVQLYITEIYDVDVAEMVRSHSLCSVPLSANIVHYHF